jgi:TrpR-related protein YerC/YecD
MNWENTENKMLIKAILALKTEQEAKQFLRDLLTEGEIIEFGKRFQTAELLSANVPYSDIEKKTGLSSTTIARVSKWLNKGMGGYQLMIARLHHINPSRK